MVSFPLCNESLCETCACSLTSLAPASDDVVTLFSRVLAGTTFVVVLLWSVIVLRFGVWCWTTTFASMKKHVGLSVEEDADDGADFVRRKAREIMATSCARRGLRCNIVLGAISYLFLVRNLVQMHVACVWSGEPDVEFLRDVVLNGLHVDLIFGSVAGMVPMVFPQISGSFVHAVHGLFYMLIMLHWWSFSDSLSLFWKNGLLTVVRVVCGILFGNSAFVVVLNVMYFVCAVVRVVSSDSLVEHAAKIMSFEIFVCLAICGVSVVHESSLRKEAIANAKAAIACRQERMAQELLTLLCDAIVYLDDSLRVRWPSPALASLMLQQSPLSQGYCGATLEELLCPEDRNRFRDFILGSGGRAQSIHVHLIDCSGIRVAVQLLHTPAEDLCGEICHLVGIREESDSERLLRQPPAATVDQFISDVVKSGRTQSESGSDFLPLSLLSSDSSSECEVCIDVLSNNLTFLECTPSFTSLGGPIRQGDGLLDWVSADESALVIWLQQSVNQMLGGHATTPQRFRFVPPHHQPVIEIVADCELRDLENQDSLDENGSPDSNNEVRVRVIFANISELNRHSRRRRSSRRRAVPRTTRLFL